MENGWIDFSLKPIVAGEEAEFLVYDSYTGRVLETIGSYIVFAGVIGKYTCNVGV